MHKLPTTASGSVLQNVQNVRSLLSAKTTASVGGERVRGEDDKKKQ